MDKQDNSSKPASSTSQPKPKDPLAATRKLALQMEQNPQMRAAMRKALKAMGWEPGMKPQGNE